MLHNAKWRNWSNLLDDRCLPRRPAANSCRTSLEHEISSNAAQRQVADLFQLDDQCLPRRPAATVCRTSIDLTQTCQDLAQEDCPTWASGHGAVMPLMSGCHSHAPSLGPCRQQQSAGNCSGPQLVHAEP